MSAWSSNELSSSNSAEGGGSAIPGGVEEEAALRQQKLDKQRKLLEARVARKRQSAGLMQPSERAMSARSRPASGSVHEPSSGLHGAVCTR